MSEILVHLRVVPDRPRNLWLAHLGHDGPCGTGATVIEALESLATRLRREAEFLIDDVIEKVANGQTIKAALWLAPREGV